MKINNIPDILTRARWIWPDNLQYDLVNGYALFRKHFQPATVPPKALLHLTAEQAYNLSINGRSVCRGPARGYQKHWPFDNVDGAAFLHKGSNLIALRAYNPGCGNFQYVNQGFAGIHSLVSHCAAQNGRAFSSIRKTVRRATFIQGCPGTSPSFKKARPGRWPDRRWFL